MDTVYEMCLNGVVQPDLEPHPGAYEIKNRQAPVSVKEKNALKGTFIVRNKYLELDLKHLNIEWQVVENGLVIEAGKMEALDIKPEECGELEISYTLPTAKPGAEYFMNIYLTLNKDLPWAAIGHEIYSCQFILPLEAPDEVICKPGISGDLEMFEKEGHITVEGENFEITFDKTLGVLTSYIVNGKKLVNTGVTENYFRPPTGIDDSISAERSISADWYKAGLERLQRKVDEVEVNRKGSGSICIEVSSSLHAEGVEQGFKSFISYTIFGDGSISIDNKVEAGRNLPSLPRIGVTLVIPQEFNNLQWYGRGPHENYSDRKSSAHIGIYESSVGEQHYPYIVPTECGGKEDVRWFSLTDNSGCGILIKGFEPIHMDIHRNSVEDYTKARHTVELIPRDEIFINIDHIHSGLGGDDGWSKNIHEEYRVKPGRYNYSFMVKPI